MLRIVSILFFFFLIKSVLLNVCLGFSRIMAVDSADEFYSIMGVLTREMLEFGLMDCNELVQTIVSMASFPFPQLQELREKYTFDIRPFAHNTTSAHRKSSIRSKQNRISSNLT